MCPLGLRGQKTEGGKVSEKKLVFEGIGNSPQVTDHSDLKFIIVPYSMFSNYKSKLNLFSIAKCLFLTRTDYRVCGFLSLSVSFFSHLNFRDGSLVLL